jgi:Flp pilus assembly protein TadB
MPEKLLHDNVQKMNEIMKEVTGFSNRKSQLSQTGMAPQQELRLLEDSITGLIKQLEVINNAIPEIVKGVKFYADLPPFSDVRKKPIKGMLKVRYQPEKHKDVKELGIKKKEHVKFLEGVTKARQASKKLEKKKASQGVSIKDTKSTAAFIRTSNKMFGSLSAKLVKERAFQSLNKELRKITSPFLLNTYISMMLFATMISLIIGIFLGAAAFIFIGVGVAIGIVVIAPLTTFLLFYSYPSSERKNLEKEINQELPFVAIYMGAVATSGIEPSQIFSILVKTKDYPKTQREIKKLLNYINYYGYDLVNALRYASKTSPSEKLAMLFNGMGTTIRSGGELTDFLKKHSETLLFDYRIEREKYTKLSETFMDIYISIVIAAPMIMMILFVLIFLNMKQPKF